MGFNGDLYPSAGASVVMTTSGDMVKYQSGARARLGIGSANQILQVKSSLPSWETVDLADTVLTTAGDVLYENSTPELARLPKGTQYNNLQMGSALPAWSASPTSVLTGAMDVLYSSSANTLARLGAGTAGKFLTTQGTGSAPTWTNPTLSFIVSLTAEDGNLTVADNLAQIRMPFAFTLSEVRAFVNTAPTGSALTFDITQGGSTVLSTLITIDVSEKTSEDASTPPVISDATLDDDVIIGFNCDVIGSSTAGAGGKIMLIGYQTI